MTVVVQQAINGAVLGSLHVLVALGLTLIHGVLSRSISRTPTS
jgi:branched-subunit amino acid ABC-type transport system permease component